MGNRRGSVDKREQQRREVAALAYRKFWDELLPQEQRRVEEEKEVKEVKEYTVEDLRAGGRVAKKRYFESVVRQRIQNIVEERAKCAVTLMALRKNHDGKRISSETIHGPECPECVLIQLEKCNYFSMNVKLNSLRRQLESGKVVLSRDFGRTKKQCRLCGNLFSSIQSLNNHRKQIHKEGRE